MALNKDWMSDDNRNPACSDANLVQSDGGFYEIHIKGQLDSRWSEWLEGLEIKLLENGEMILLGSIVDQAALLGVLNKLSHLNLTLLSVNRVKRKTKRRQNE
jgi:hypothetical protein